MGSCYRRGADADHVGAFNLVQLLIAVYGFRLDREPMGPLWALPLQQFVYRQLMYPVIIESTVSALQGCARAGSICRGPAMSSSAAPADGAAPVSGRVRPRGA